MPPGCPIDPFLPPWCFPSCPNGLSCLPGASLLLRRLSFPASLVPPWCLAGCPSDPFLPPWCLASCFLPPWCLPGASQAVQMVLSCLLGASLSKGILCSERHFKSQSVLGSRPWSPPQDLPRTGPFAIEIVLKVRQNPAPFQKPGFDRQSCATSLPGASVVPPGLSKWLFPTSLVPP